MVDDMAYYMSLGAAANAFAQSVNVRNAIAEQNPGDAYLCRQANERVWETWITLLQVTGELEVPR